MERPRSVGLPSRQESSPMMGKAIKQGGSTLADPAAAVVDLYNQLAMPDMELVVFHCSAAYDLSRVADTINKLFQGVTVVGCTTAGEIGLSGYQEGGICGYSFAKFSATATVQVFNDLSGFSVAEGVDAITARRHELEDQVGSVTPLNTFAFMMIDGLSMREEMVARAVHGGLGEIPLIGGSAGDGLRFEQTNVFHDGAFRSNCAVVVLVQTLFRFKAFKTQHFIRTEERIVVTDSVPSKRTIMEINGYPAVQEYARAVGLTVKELTPMIFAAYPVMVRIGDAEYMRSIQRVTPEGDLVFYCAIDTGIVLTVAKGVDLIDNLERALHEVVSDIGQPQIIIGCDCILRNLEIKQKGLLDRASQVLKRYRVVGFNTYGEQFNGMHVNQTFTGIAIGAEQ